MNFVWKKCIIRLEDWHENVGLCWCFFYHQPIESLAISAFVETRQNHERRFFVRLGSPPPPPATSVYVMRSSGKNRAKTDLAMAAPKAEEKARFCADRRFFAPGLSHLSLRENHKRALSHFDRFFFLRRRPPLCPLP